MAYELDPTVMKSARSYLEALRRDDIRFDSAWLFGSVVNGRFTADSDIDIALVMKDVQDKVLQEVELTKYRRQIDLRIEPHIIMAEQLDTPFSKEILRTGIQLA